MSDRMSSQQVAHENLNTLAEIMMSDIHGGDSCAHETKSKVVEVPVEAPPKRRRGRPPKGSYGGVAAETIIKKKLAVDDGDGDEDVCFVCFDGGSLVLCDRRGCPKAYHPACIKRDEAFFQSKAKWNCGWHLCNTCQKASYYMCYTCPYSLCKGCTKDADYVSVRGTKGFCGLCLRTIMLIENSVQGSQESAQVDFDDKGSWEYLFKVYWVSLKGELSLTLDELTRAKNPWKGDEAMPQKLGSYHKSLQAVNPKRRKINTQPKLLAGELTINMGKEGRDPVAAWRGNGALNQVDPASAIISNLSNQLMATSETSSACLFRSTGIFSSDLDRIWHYQDPSGKVQGPFSMSQLRKWSMSGHFPSDLRIWRVFERQDSSVLLTDALYVQHDKKLLPSCNSLTHSQDMKSTQPIGVSYSIGQLNNSNALQRDGKNVNKVQQPIQYVIGLKCNNPRSYQGSTRDGIMTSKNGDNFSAERKNRTTTTVQKESKTSEVNQNIKACKFDSQCNNYSERISNNKVDNQSSSQNAGTGVVSMSEQRGSTSQGEDSQGGNVDSTSQPNVFSPSEKCTPYQMKVGSGNENCNPGQINTIGCPSNTAESQINSGSSIDKQSISEDYSSQSSEQSRRPPYMISPLDVWDTKSASAANSYEMSRKNDQVSVPVHSSLTEKPSSENLNDQGIGSREPVSGIRIRDSGPHWSTASSQERVMEQCKEITSEWSRCSPTFYKPGEDLDCSLVSGSNMRPADIVGDHVTTSVSASDQQRHFPESHSASNPSAWQDIVAEPDEFCCLVEESVSDLLAEVEAMESRNANGPGTPTSIMNCGGELTDGSIEYCFSPGGTLSSGGIISPPDPGKVDAFSITDNRKLHSRSTVTDEQNPMKRSDGQICHSNEVERDARNSDVSVNQLELCGVHPSPPSIGDCNTSNTDTSSRHPDSEATGNNLGPVQDNANLSWLNLLKATEPLFGDL